MDSHVCVPGQSIWRYGCFLLCHYKCSIQLSPAYPTLHYAYNSMPSILEPYNPMVPSNVCTTINNHHQYFETSVGRVLQDLNSETGVLRSAFKQLVETSQKCPGCLCQFSRDGYMGHLGLNENSYHCLNTPGCPIGKLNTSILGLTLIYNLAFSYDATTGIILPISRDHGLWCRCSYRHWLRLACMELTPRHSGGRLGDDFHGSNLLLCLLQSTHFRR